MTTYSSTPIWQRVVCGLLCVAGAVALIANVLEGSVHGILGIVGWVIGVLGAVIFARVAFHKPIAYRSVDAMPVPSSQVGRFVEEHRQVEAIKAYRAEAAASLFEAKAVIDHYWPNHSSKRTREKPRAA